MAVKKKYYTMGMLVAITASAMLASRPVRDRNLKVLPQDISEQKLDSIMHSYNTALGVECKFCHVPFMGFKDSFDFASDKEPMKENARNMMRMMIEVNKNYFWFDKNQRPEYLRTVACITCHRGEELPPENR
jgi:hypothetical protein